MNIKKTTALVVALGALVLAANAQDNNPPNDGPPGADAPRPGMRQNGGPMAQRGFHVLPPFAAQQLNLTDDQKKQIAALDAETKVKLEKILTPEQLEKLKNLHPPMMRQGQGGPRMRGGPGGDDSMPPHRPPQGGDEGNNPPPDGPPGDQ
jgi:Spy/CpxP family protein refolding chaperone